MKNITNQYLRGIEVTHIDNTNINPFLIFMCVLFI